jgi:CheY-like chemotaxis protein
LTRTWVGRLRQSEDSDIQSLIFVDAEHAHVSDSPTAALLVGGSSTETRDWPLDGHVLVLDSDDQARQECVASLVSGGCSCHAASSRQEAHRILQRDPDILITVVDFEAAQGDLAGLMIEFQSSRPAAVLIGSGSISQKHRFSELGVMRFLPKPWDLNDLLAVVRPQ